MSLTDVSKYIKELKDKDMIRYSEYDEWMLNPELVWKGSVEGREEALISWQKLNSIKKPETCTPLK